MRAQNNHPNPIAQCALSYVDLGARVFPCKADKSPLTRHGLKDASSDPAVILAWWSHWPHADIGLAVSSSFIVIDVDRKRNQNGFKDFLELEGREAFDVRTPIASTVSGGAHIFYRADGRQYRNGVQIGGASIDLRAPGGYVIAPAGAQSGRAWIRPPTGPWAPAPDWLKREYEARAARETACQNPDIAGFEADLLSALGANGRYRGDTPKGIGALKGVCQDIVDAPRGSRDTILTAKFYKIGALIAEGELGAHAAQAVLEAGLAMRDPLPKEVVLEKQGGSLRRAFRMRVEVEGAFGSKCIINESATSYRSAPWRKAEADRFSFGWFR
jgi:hypothetical protein